MTMRFMLITWLLFTSMTHLRSNAGERIHADLLIHNAYVLSMDADFAAWPKGAVAIADGKIVAIGSGDSLSAKVKAKARFDAKGNIVMPGLINAHTHAAMTLFRGMADDAPLKSWLEDHIWPAEAKFVTPENVAIGTRLALVEMIRSGTTTFNDGYFFIDTIAEVIDEAGMRAVISEPVADFPMPGAKNPDMFEDMIEKAVLRWGKHPRIQIAVGPHSTYSCGPELLKRVQALADKHGLPVHIHVSETPSEVADVKARYGRTPIGQLHHLGMVKKGLIAAHCVEATADEIALFAKMGAGISHNPQSNMKLGSGMAPVPEMLAASVKLGMGTDSVASNNNLDMLEEMATVAFMQKVRKGNPEAIKARDIVHMATLGSARALGLETKVGSLEVGKQADLIVVNIHQPHMTPMYDPYSTLVFVATGSDVDSLMVDGRFLMQARKLKTLDEKAAMAAVSQVATQIAAYSAKK